MLGHNWQQADWPEFRYDAAALTNKLQQFAEKTGHGRGLASALTVAAREEALLEALIAEAIKTSEIEGEFLSRKDVYSSIKNNLGLSAYPLPVNDKRAAGIGELVVAVRQSFEAPLSEHDLFKWHKMILGWDKNVRSGEWRTHTADMQVVSSRGEVHFTAPPSANVPLEMARYIKWYNDTAPGGTAVISSAPVRAAIAHLYFETIHPFEDGNGRMGRAIAERALSQSMGWQPMMSISRALENSRAKYYLNLQTAQESNEITEWIFQFIDVLIQAQDYATDWIHFSLRKAQFYDQFKHAMNERQGKVIRRMLDEGPQGFEGGMNATKYCSLTGASKATATRDLQDLLHKEIFTLIGESGGRSTRYALNI